MREVILNVRRVFTGRIFGLETCEVRLPNGHLAKREVIRHPGAAAVVALDEEGRVLLVRQYRVAADRMMIEIPAGLLDGEEAPEECAIRELQEETGYKPGQIQALGGFYVAAGYTSEYIHLFVATGLVESRLPGDTDEFIEIERVMLQDALAMVERGEIADSKTIIALLRYARLQGI